MQKPVAAKVKGLRQRRRSDGSWRVWWEPTAAEKALGFSAVELDPNKPTWSQRKATELGAEVAARRAGAGRVARSGAHMVGALIGQYRTSRQFLRLRPATHRDYRQKLRTIEDKWGADPVASFTKPIMRAWYETLLTDKGPFVAKGLLTMMSTLMGYAEMIGWRAEDSNPCLRLKTETPPNRKTVATWEEFDALVAADTALDMGGVVACGCALAILQGTRLTDAINAAPDDFQLVPGRFEDGDNGGATYVWHLHRSKRGNYSAIELHLEAAGYVGTFLSRATPDQTHLLLDPVTGKPFNMDRFGKRFAEVRAHAAETLPSVARLQYRDLRRTFGVLARIGGASPDDVADILGNSANTDPRLRRTYMPGQIETVSRAVHAVKRPSKAKD